MELLKEIRREYEFGEGTIKGAARKLQVHRRLIRQAVLNAIPASRKKTNRPHLKLQPAIPFIDSILDRDRNEQRKQRHTAHRIWKRVKDEFPNLQVSERTVGKYVRKRKLGTRDMIELLSLGRTHGYDRLRQVVESTLEMGSCDVATVRYLLTAEELNRVPTEPIAIGLLCRFERFMPEMTAYDQLLTGGEVLQ